MKHSTRTMIEEGLKALIFFAIATAILILVHLL